MALCFSVRVYFLLLGQERKGKEGMSKKHQKTKASEIRISMLFTREISQNFSTFYTNFMGSFVYVFHFYFTSHKVGRDRFVQSEQMK